MADALDRASELETLQRDKVLQAQRSQYLSGAPSLEYCQDCDAEIPAKRRAFGGITRCVDCQHIAELQGQV